jgi:hypothetical protein
VKVQRKGHVSKTMLLYRYRAQNAIMPARSQPVGCRVLATRSRRTPLRTDHGEIAEVLVPAAYPAVGECSPMWVISPLTAAVDQTDDPEKAHGTTNVGLSEGRTRTSLSAVPIVYRTDRSSRPVWSRSDQQS